MTCLTPAQQRAARAMSEADLQDAVDDLALSLGYMILGLPDSRGQKAEGWPDRFYLPRRSPGPPLFVEFKTEESHLTEGRMLPTRDGRGRWATGQEEWRDALLAAGQHWYLWRPSNWLDGTIERALKEGHDPA